VAELTEPLERALAARLPDVLRWGGAVARRLRGYDIALGGKASGRADIDALTLADLAVQELIVAAVRDTAPLALRCRIEAEEAAGDLARFDPGGEWVLAIDPIDGTRTYRDRTGPGYGIMVHLRTRETVRYSLVYLPEEGPDGGWLEVVQDRVVVGPDDHGRPARAVLDGLPAAALARRPATAPIWVGGFHPEDDSKAHLVSAAGLEAVTTGSAAGSVYPRLARGELGGALLHTPNVYDFPVLLHVARALGGDAVWVGDGRPVDFRESWFDARAAMLRLPGIVACAVDPAVLRRLVELARDWTPVRYAP
jgi:3'(2'), 5'-bisphosphate nucleotidase